MEPALSPAGLNRRYLWLLFVINLSIPFFIVIDGRSNGLSRAVTILCGWVSAAFINLVFALSFRSRLRRMGATLSRTSVVASIALAAISGLLSTVSVAVFGQTTDYLKLARSDTPLSAIQPERTRILVELVRRRAAGSAEYAREAAAMKPISPDLYSVQSFSSKETMLSIADQLQRAYQMDVAYSDSLNQSARDFHDRMQKVDPTYLQSFEANMRDSDSVNEATLSTEDQWVKCTSDLYTYAAAHADKISVAKDNKQVIPDPSINNNLNQQIDSCKALQQKMSDERAKAVQLQQDAGNRPH